MINISNQHVTILNFKFYILKSFYFSIFSLAGLLDNLRWENLFVAGGALLACVRSPPSGRVWSPDLVHSVRVFGFL